MTLLKRHRQLLLVGLLLLYPLGSFLAGGPRPRWLDRAIIALTAPLQRGITGGIDGGVRMVRAYITLHGVREENEVLRLENLRMHAAVQALGEARLENERLKKLLGYTEAASGPEIPARVLGVNPAPKLLSVRINRGEADGVERGMSVVTPEGIVGQVVRTTGGYADVALVTDPMSRVAIRVQRSRARATAAGAGLNPLRLETALRTEDISEGDLVITAGTDGVYPPGLVVGRVSALEKSTQGMFQHAEIIPAVDTTKLEEVLVIPSSGLAQYAPATAGESTR
nr:MULTISPECIES: rod shape-determining protein MreC [Myxococcaceae]